MPWPDCQAMRERMQKVKRLSTPSSSYRCGWPFRFWRRVLRCAPGVDLLPLACCFLLQIGWLSPGTICADDIGGPQPDPTQPITVAADWCTRWQQGVYEVYHLRGNCYLNQGLTYARAPEAVLWVDRAQSAGHPTKMIAYMEGGPASGVAVDYQPAKTGSQGSVLGREQAPTWFQRFYTSAPLRTNLPEPAPAGAVRPAIYDRGLRQFDPQRRRQLMLAQFTEFAPAADATQPLPPGMRSIQFSGRSDVAPNLESRELPSGDRVVLASGGIRVLVEGLSTTNLPASVGPIGTLDISTDRAVIWTAGGVGVAGQSLQRWAQIARSASERCVSREFGRRISR